MRDDSHVPTWLEADARAIVPVHDEIGGTVIYVHGRPAYYVLHGEWFPAVTHPVTHARARGIHAVGAAELDGRRIDEGGRDDTVDQGADRHGPAVSTS